MLIDILQELYDAIELEDTDHAEEIYEELRKLGMDRLTAQAVLVSGAKFFISHSSVVKEEVEET